MTRNDFYERILEEVKNIVGSNGEVIFREVRKNNNVMLHGISIKYPGKTAVLPVVYLEYYNVEPERYDSYTVIHDIAKDVIETIKDNMENSPEKSITEIITNLEKVKDLIIPRVINQKTNKKALENKAFTPFLDLVITYVIDVTGIINNGSTASIAVTNELLNKWNISRKILHEFAMNNLMKKQAIILNISEMFNYLFDSEPSELLQMTGLTNDSGTFGASMILRDDVLRNLLDKFQTDKLVIIPSSVHELIVMPNNEINEDLNNIIDSVNGNKSLVHDDEYLSDHYYLYDKEHGLYY